jgi:hypothetical protein
VLAARRDLQPDLVGLCSTVCGERRWDGPVHEHAQGGMVTADNRLRGGQEARTWAGMRRIGPQLADEALRIIAPAPEQSDPSCFAPRGPSLRWTSPDAGAAPGAARSPARGQERDHANQLVNSGRPVSHHPGRGAAQHRLLFEAKMRATQPPVRSHQRRLRYILLRKITTVSNVRLHHADQLGERTGRFS